MRTTPVDRFVKYITPWVEGCPDFVARREVIATVAEICRETGCLLCEAALTTEKGRGDYTIPMDDGLHVEKVRSVRYDGRLLPSVRLDEMEHPRNVNGFAVLDGASEPQCYTFKRMDELLLYPAPTKEAVVLLDVWATVDRDTKQVPEQFFDDWIDTVAAGSLSRIYRIAGQTYSNLQMAERNLLTYQSGLNAIRQDAARDYTREAGHVIYNRFI